MAKYRVSMGALVTKLMKRTFVVHAKSEEEAIEKAEFLFHKACSLHRYTECPDTINVDSIRKEE